jgi:hypothetical protein
MKKYIIYYIVVISVILLLLITTYAALYCPGDASYRRVLEFKHEKLIFSISEAVSNRKMINIKISELPERCFSDDSDYKDLKNNSIISFYSAYVSIVPGFIFINQERIIETKFHIDKDGFIIVYSYFLPQNEKNILVTINKLAEPDNSFKSKTKHSLYVQNYMDETELIAFLNEKGLAINKLYLDVPLGGIKVLPRQESILLGPIMMALIFIILILFSVFSSSILIYKKKIFYSYLFLILSAILTIIPLFCFGYALAWYLIGAFILSFIVLTGLILLENGVEPVR